MSVLKDIQSAIQLRLRSQSNQTLESVRHAVKAVLYLHVHDCNVLEVTVRRDHVIIEIDQPSQWLTGRICVRRINGPYRETVKVTKVLDCQVQWVEREPHPLLRREG